MVDAPPFELRFTAKYPGQIVYNMDVITERRGVERRGEEYVWPKGYVTRVHHHDFYRYTPIRTFVEVEYSTSQRAARRVHAKWVATMTGTLPNDIPDAATGGRVPRVIYVEPRPQRLVSLGEILGVTPR